MTGSGQLDENSRRTMVRFEERDGRRFPYPLADVTVRGQPTKLILDTGASHHALATWILERSDVPVIHSKENGFDHFGRSFDVFEAQRPDLVIDGWGPVEDSVMFAIEYTPIFEHINVGGILSPQQLILPDGAIVLDLLAGELYRIPAGETGVADSELIDSGAELWVTPSDILPAAPRYVVPAVIDGHAVRLVVDSGASRSNLYQASAVGRRLAAGAGADPEHQMHSVGGNQPTASVGEVQLSVWGITRVISTLDLVPGTPQPASACDGKLGMDVLRGCRLFLQRDRLRVSHAPRCSCREWSCPHCTNPGQQGVP